MDTQTLRSEVKNHLETKILPFWENLRDTENGGFYGYMDFDLNVDKKAVKGCTGTAAFCGSSPMRQ